MTEHIAYATLDYDYYNDRKINYYNQNDNIFKSSDLTGRACNIFGLKVPNTLKRNIFINLYYYIKNNIDNSDNKSRITYICVKSKMIRRNVMFVKTIIINENSTLFETLFQKLGTIKECVNHVVLNSNFLEYILHLIKYDNIIKFNNYNDCVEYVKQDTIDRVKYYCYTHNNFIYSHDTIFTDPGDSFTKSNRLYKTSNLYKHYNTYHLFKLAILCELNGFKNISIGWHPSTDMYEIYYNNFETDINNTILLSVCADNIDFTNTIIKSCTTKSIININNNNKYKAIKLTKELNDKFTINVDDKIKMKLFDYQKDNITWMNFIETTKPKFKTLYNINNLKYNYEINYVKYPSTHDNSYTYTDKSILFYGLPYNTDNSTRSDINLNNKCLITTLNISHQKNNYERAYEHVYGHFNYELKDSKEAALNSIKGGKVRMKGGIIADDVGLGKTLTTISYLVANRDKDRQAVASGNADLGTLVILPNRLVAQWKHEIGNYLKDGKYLKIRSIGTITDIKKLEKLSIEKLKEIDIFLVSNTIFGNDKYIQKYVIPTKDDTEATVNLFNKNWNRIIIDEAHELITTETLNSFNDNLYKNRRHYKRDHNPHRALNYSVDYSEIKNLVTKVTLKKKEREIAYNIVHNLKSNYRWCLTATPFMNGENNFVAYLYWLSDYEFDVTYNKNFINFDYMTEIFNNPENNKLYYSLIPDPINNKYVINSLWNEMLNGLYNMLTDNDYKKFIDLTLTKNYKSDLQTKSVIDIPLVSEEIIWINQTPVEKQIYDSYANDILYFWGDKQALLLKLCTNLLVANLFDNMIKCEDASSRTAKLQTFSLDEINNKFVGNLKEQLKKRQKELTSKEKHLTINKENLVKVSKIQTFFNTMSQDKYLKFMKSILELYGDTTTSANQLKSELTANGIHGIENFISEKDMRVVFGIINNYSFGEYRQIVNDFMDNCISLDDVRNNLEEKVKEYLSLYLTIQNGKRSEHKYITHAITLTKCVDKIEQSSRGKVVRAKDAIKDLKYSIERLNNQIVVMDDEDFIKERVKDPCIICWEDYTDDTEIIITKCRHIMCVDCFNQMMSSNVKISCPECRGELTMKDVSKSKVKPDNPDEQPAAEVVEIQDEFAEAVNKYGSKMAMMVKYLKRLFTANDQDRVIIFSQYDEMLRLISKVLKDFKIKHVYCKGNVNVVSKNIIKFKENPDYRVILLSSDKANSGSNLTEASHIFLIDVLNMPKHKSIDTETQAIGRSVRLGQKKSVKVVRFITRATVEEVKYKENKYNLLDIK